jgi:hypothetical protein
MVGDQPPRPSPLTNPLDIDLDMVYLTLQEYAALRNQVISAFDTALPEATQQLFRIGLIEYVDRIKGRPAQQSTATLNNRKENQDDIAEPPELE